MPKRQPASRPREQFLYTFYIQLFDVEPVIWRRFSVPSHVDFATLHDVIQVVMGWDSTHLYAFRFGPFEISEPDDEFFIVDNRHLDATHITLSDLDFEQDDVLTYVYDFGDNWTHLLRVESVSLIDRGTKAIQCEAGARACPPEDVGGPFGYDLHLKALADENDPGHADALDWSGPFDAEAFDVDAVNERLSAHFPSDDNHDT